MTTNFGNTIASIPVANTPTLVINSNVTLTGAAYGKSYKVTGAYVVTLPTLISGSSGMNIGFMNDSTSSVTLNCQGSDYVRVMGVSVATITLVPGDSMVLQNTGGTFCLADSNPTKASLSSPTFTGTPLAPTAAVNTSTTQIATTAFVIGQASGLTPSADAAVASSGASNTFARGDHVHPGPGAGVVGFQLSATGAAVQTLFTKASQTVSVTDFYANGVSGALVDPTGVIDSSGGFAAACTYLYVTGGGTLNIPFGTYKNARVEVHANMQVNGNGSTVQYLGIGQTIIAGTGTGTGASPSPWPADSGYLPSIPATTMFTLASAVSLGDTILTLVSAAGITAGMFLFVAGNPSSMSTAGNYIPRDFEFVKVLSVAGNVVTLSEPMQSTYLTTQSGVFYAPGLAINCHIRDLTVNTSIDAYQQVVRSSYGCTIEDVVFAGASAVGAATFSDGLVYNNIEVVGTTGGGMSTARGTVSCAFNNINIKTASVQMGIFIEESLYKVTLNNIKSTGWLALGSLDCSSSQQKRLVRIDNSQFNPSVYGGLNPPFTSAVVNGVDIIASNSIFQGAVTVPNSASYPGITGSALIWLSNNTPVDTVTFNNCEFISANSGNTWPSNISGFTGTVRFDNLCTFTTCTIPNTLLYPNSWGTFTPTIYGQTTAGTVTYTTQTGMYVKTGLQVSVNIALAWSSMSGGAGNMRIGGLPFTANGTQGGFSTAYDGTLTAANSFAVNTTPGGLSMLLHGGPAVNTAGAAYINGSYLAAT